jgi:hypothetical protein
MGKPIPSHIGIPESEFIGLRGETRGSETSQYPEEKKTRRDSASSGERTRKSLNHPACGMGLRDLDVVSGGIVERSGKADRRR